MKLLQRKHMSIRKFADIAGKQGQPPERTATGEVPWLHTSYGNDRQTPRETVIVRWKVLRRQMSRSLNQ